MMRKVGSIRSFERSAAELGSMTLLAESWYTRVGRHRAVWVYRPFNESQLGEPQPAIQTSTSWLRCSDIGYCN